MNNSVLRLLILTLISLLYIGLFTYLVAVAVMQWFDFDMLRKPQAVMVTLGFAASTLFASPLIPYCHKIIDKLTARYVQQQRWIH